MKLTINLNKILVVVAVVTVLAFGWVKYRSLVQEKEASESRLEELIKSDLEEKKIQKEMAQKDSIRKVEIRDSSKRVFNALELKRKADNNYYQNKLKALEKVNTYTLRQRYSDSLARAVRQ